MKAIPLCFAALVLTSATARAQEPITPTPVVAKTHESLSLGMTVHRFQDDFGIGATLSSPSFAAQTLRVTAAGGVAWYPHGRSSSGNETWNLYGHTRLVLEAGRRIAGTPVRLYGFGGATLLITPSSISSDPARLGGLGGFGFEFYMPKHGIDGPVSYTLELGGFGTAGLPDGDAADKLPNRPIFGSGFMINVGMRIYPFRPKAHAARTRRGGSRS